MPVVISWGPVCVGQKSDHFLPHRELPNMRGGIDSRKDGLGPFLRK